MNIAHTLEERGKRYGDFEHHARIAQRIQDAMRCADGWENLAPDQKQALTVIADKIARMLNGDPSYIDNWHDIVGYATLVESRMNRDAAKAVAANDNQPKMRGPLNADSTVWCCGADGKQCKGCPRA